MISAGTPDLLAGLKAASLAGHVALLLGALFLGLPMASAGEMGKTYKVGFLSPSDPSARFNELRRETLRNFGYVEGRDFLYMERWAGGSKERLHRDAAELVEMKVDVILATTSAGVRAAANATKTVPIVAIDLTSDPVANGWVASLARPGGNVTGFFLHLPELGGKRLEQLKEVVPGLSRVAVLWDTSQDRTPLKATEVAARALGLRMIKLEVRRPEELERAFKNAINQRAQAVLLMQSPMFDGSASQIAALATKSRLPIAGFLPFHSESGFLMSYGPDVDALIRQSIAYCDRILKGEKPGDLPVQRPAKFVLVLNLKTAKLLGITFPKTLLFQANHVIKD